jgi:UDP-N-acetylglucosamine transferase subunit ALG13
VIFLTIGSHEPFDRLVKPMDTWAAAHPEQKVFGQITSQGQYKPKHFSFADYLDPAGYKARVDDALLLVGHAGMGSIITAMDLGKTIAIMPRRGHLQETRNDHQYATAMKFRGKPGIFVAENEHALATTVDEALAYAVARGPGAKGTPFAQQALTRFLAGVISG